MEGAGGEREREGGRKKAAAGGLKRKRRRSRAEVEECVWGGALNQSGVSVSCQSSGLSLFLYHQITDSTQTDQKHVNKHQREKNELKPQEHLY